MSIFKSLKAKPPSAPKSSTTFHLKIPDGTPGLERLVLGPEFHECISKDANGEPVLIVPTPHGTNMLTIRSGMELTPEEAESLVWYFTTLGGTHETRPQRGL